MSKTREAGKSTAAKSAYALAGLLAAAGLTHLAYPKPYDRIVPRVLPGPARWWTYGSGAAELAVAAAVAHPRTRRSAAAAAAGLLVAVFPANVQMARDWRGRGTTARNLAYARLPLQAPLVAWALQVRRSASRG
ncbi:hypothetical protein KDK95_09600 [Actinospica sp. MGRD01-02]|uniref:Methylamine utilisation protein MauE domain-containing protein n=1 Tax=Actinospica acidithermotolerans TaxID=2828514 RepID=A0A941II96_9ACTN|nr:MauE/DoxX family redox-associated membrane protein [Actinospica acidithermotolerans]MBR7826557.1 hypothetical protein [Actinospica acidithermotolerans]